MANFDELIAQLNRECPEEWARGKAFEPICKWFLTEDPYYGEEFRNVWLWDEWPDRWGPDIGIDLVAERHPATAFLLFVDNSDVLWYCAFHGSADSWHMFLYRLC
jgi:predicted helicase